MFHYCLALLMVEARKARLIGQEPGEAGAVYTFETVNDERFTLARPSMSREVGAEVWGRHRDIATLDSIRGRKAKSLTGTKGFRYGPLIRCFDCPENGRCKFSE
jgi:hypothetical protein